MLPITLSTDVDRVQRCREVSVRADDHERPLDPVVDGAELTVEGGLIVAPEIAGLPAVEPAGYSAGQCGVGERGDELPQRGLWVLGGGLVRERGAVHQLLAQVEHRVPEQFVLAGVMAVQSGRGDADPSGDGIHADAVVTERAERLGRRPGNLRLAVFGPAPNSIAAGARHGR